MAAGVLKTVMTVTSHVAGGWQNWERLDDGRHWRCRATSGVTVQVWPRTGTVSVSGSTSASESLRSALSIAGVFSAGKSKKRKKPKKAKRSAPVPHVGDRVEDRRAMYQARPRSVPVSICDGLGPTPGDWSAEQMYEPW